MTGVLALAESLTPESIANASKGAGNPAEIQKALMTLLRDPMKEVAPPPPPPETPVSVASEVRKTAQEILNRAQAFDTLLEDKEVEEVLKKAAAVLELEKQVG